MLNLLTTNYYITEKKVSVPISKALILTQAQINPRSTHTSPNRVKIVLNTKPLILTQYQIQTLPTHTAQMRFELFPITEALILTQTQINPCSVHTGSNCVKIVLS